MKKYFKQLSTSDILVALISQDTTIDHTDNLKLFLSKQTRSILQNDKEAQQLIFLPEFSIYDISEEELVLYHLRKNNCSNENILNYESLLGSVDAKMQKIIDNSGNSFEKSNQIINELILKLGESCTFVTEERKPLKYLSKHIKEKYISICRKITKIHNMVKTLDVMKFWNSSNISKILSIRPENISKCQQVDQIFKRFNEITQFLSEKKNEFANYSNLIALVNERKKETIQAIYNNALNCIKNYSNDNQLKTILNQYEYILQNELIREISSQKRQVIEQQSLFSQHNLPKLIQLNILSIYQSMLEQNHKTINLEQTSDNNFIDYYRDLMKQFTFFFNNWHKVTTFHIQQQTKYKDGFIKHRTVVFQKMLQKIQYLLKYSSKITSLSLPKLINLFDVIHDFIESGEQWMGKCKTSLPQLLLEKYQQEINNYFKLKNGEIKNSLFQQFTFSSSNEQKQSLKHYFDSDFPKFKLTIRDEVQTLIRQFKVEQIDTNRALKLLGKSIKQQSSNSQLIQLDRQQLLKQMNVYFERLNSKLSVKLYKIIIEYQLRQQCLKNSNQLNLIYQQFEYILVIVYKLCIPNYMKKELEQEIFNQYNRSNKVSQLKTALNKNTLEEETIGLINQLRHSFLDRTTYGLLYDFILANSSRYEGISLTSYINANLYFQQPDKHENELALLSQIFLFVMNELCLLVDYIENLLTKNRFNRPQQEILQKIGNLKNILASLVLYYFTTYFESSLKKYYSQVVPLFEPIKFQVKRLNDLKGSLKDYRGKICQIYNHFNVERYSRQTCFHVMLSGKQQEYFFKFIIDLFSKIEKVNDNGRQILKQQANEFSKLVGVDRPGSGQESWPALLDQYLQIAQERSEKAILEKVERLVLHFPIQWWRSNLLWFYNDCSTKEKKEYTWKVVNLYLNRINSLPKI